MKITTETVTPAMARTYLEKNKQNRRVSKRGVANYAEQIRKGRWKLNGDMIRFSEDGALVDGQHRLHAIIEADTPVEMMVARGLTKDTIKTLDIGRKRSNADHLEIHGIKTNADLVIVAAAVRLISLFEDGVYISKKNRYISPSDTIEFVEQNKDILHADERVPTSIGKFMPRSVAVRLYFLFSKTDREKTDVFFANLADGVDLKAGHPALTLRNKLLFMVGNKSGSGEKRQVIAYTCRAFDAYVNNEELHQLRFDPKSDIPLPVKRGKK